MRARSNLGLSSLVLFLPLVLATLGVACGGDPGVPTDAGGVFRADAGAGDAGGGSAVDAGAGDAGALDDAAPAGDTWDGYAQAFFVTYCTTCHDTVARDYRTITHVMRDAAIIRCGVTDVALADCPARARATQSARGWSPGSTRVSRNARQLPR